MKMADFKHLFFIFLFLSVWKALAESSSIKASVSNPVQANATFSADHLTIKVDFSEDLKLLGSASNCTSIFDAATIESLGSDPICTFISFKSMKVFPYKDATVKPGSSLVFNDGYLFGLSNSTLNVSEINIKSFTESTIFQPEAIITKDGYASNCLQDKQYLSADYSKNAGYSHFVSHIWNLDTIVDNTTANAIIAANDYLKELPSNDSEIEVTNVLISASTPLLLHLQNVFGGNVNRTSMISATSKPVARILGERKILLHAGKTINLVADLSVTTCGPDIESITYTWNISPNGRLKVMNEISSKILAVRLNSSVNEEGVMNISVSITYQLSNNETGVAMDSVFLTAKKTSLKPSIVGGDRMIGKDQTLILRGTELTGRTVPLNHHWTCKDAETKDICKRKNTQIELAIGNTSMVSIDMTAGNFTIGRRYQFTLSIASGLQTDSASIMVTIATSTVVVVTMLTERTSWSYDEEIIFRALITGTSVALRYEWKVNGLFGEEIRIGSSTGELTSDITTQLNRIVTLKIPSRSLLAESTYKISLLITVGNSISRGSKMQRVSLPPRYGHVVVKPKQGVAYNTTFRIRSFGWIDKSDLEPFQYRIGYIDHRDSRRHYLTTWRNLNVLPRTLLPEGDVNNGHKLIVFAEVRNTNGLTARREITLKVTTQSMAGQDGLIRYFKQMKNVAEYDQLSVVMTGILKSTISAEQKRLYIDEYLVSIGNAPFWPGLSSIFIECIWKISSLENSSSPILTKYLKGKVISFLKKLLGHMDEKFSGFRTEGSLITYVSGIVERLMPKYDELTNADTEMIESLKSAMKSFANILCKSINLERKFLNSSVVSIFSEYTDLASSRAVNEIFSISKAFRESLQLRYSGSKSSNYAGFCISITSFIHAKYFTVASDSNEIKTLVHVPKLLDLSDNTIIDPANSGQVFVFTLPVVRDYNKTEFALQCKLQSPSTKVWVDNLCSSATIEQAPDKELLRCECQKLYPIAGFKVPKPTTAMPVTGSVNGQSENVTITPTAVVNFSSTLLPETTLSPQEMVTIILAGNCTKYLQKEEKPKFINSLIINLAYQLQISSNRIRVLSLECGSIIVNLTIAERASSSEPTKPAAINTLRGLLSNGLMRITVYDGILPAVAPGVNISSLPTIPPPTTKKPEIPEYKTNWMPLFVSFVFAVVAVMLIAACIAWLHGRYYKKKHYTDINCNRPKKKGKDDADPDDPKTLNRKQKNKKLDAIMEASLAQPTTGMSSSNTLRSFTKKKRRSSVTPSTSNVLPKLSNPLRNKNVFTVARPVREVPRLALDDSSSESEQETTFSEDVSEKNNEVK